LGGWAIGFKVIVVSRRKRRAIFTFPASPMRGGSAINETK
jgi:hypothetical protein